MLLLCIDSSGYRRRISRGKLYLGELVTEEGEFKGWWLIKRCDDDDEGLFMPHRFRQFAVGEVRVERLDE